MLLFRSEAEDSKDYDREILKLFNEVIDDTMAQIDNYDNMQKANKEITGDRY
jgi:hypothetical protein